jgi:hypothetical protein
MEWDSEPDGAGSAGGRDEMEEQEGKVRWWSRARWGRWDLGASVWIWGISEEEDPYEWGPLVSSCCRLGWVGLNHRSCAECS